MREIKTLCWAWLLFSFLLIIGMVGAVENGGHANWFQIGIIVMSWFPCYKLTQKKNSHATNMTAQPERKNLNNSIVTGSERKCNDQRFRALIAQTGR